MPAPAINVHFSVFSDSAKRLGITLPCVVGGAAKGPFTPTRCFSVPDLIRTYGLPLANDFGLLAAVEALAESPSVLYLRVANGAAAANAAISGVAYADPGARATGLISFNTQPTDGNVIVIPDGVTSKNFEFDVAAAINATGSLGLNKKPADSTRYVIDDGVHAPTALEFDQASASALITVASMPTATQTLIIPDVAGTPNVLTITFQSGTGTDADTDVTEPTLASNIFLGNYSTVAQLAAAISTRINSVSNTNNPATLASNSLNAAKYCQMATVPANSNVVTARFRTTPASGGSANTLASAQNGATITGTAVSGGSITVTAFSGAKVPTAATAGASAVGISNVAGAVGTAVVDASDAITNSKALNDAINLLTGASTFTIASTASGAAASLTNNASPSIGKNGNRPILVFNDSAGAVTVTGMSGGVSPGVAIGNIQVVIGGSLSTTVSNFNTAINAAGLTLASVIGANNISLGLTHSLFSTIGNQPITSDPVSGSVWTIAGMSGGKAPINSSAAACLSIAAKDQGSLGNSVQAKIIVPTTVPGAPASNFDLAILAPVDNTGVVQTVELFRNLSMDPTSARFVETVVNVGIENDNNPSRYVVVDQLANYIPTPGTYTLGSAGNTAGVDGITSLTAADYIGSVSGSTATGLQALRNDESVTFNLLTIPGVTYGSVISEALSVCAARQDAKFLIDTPFGLTRDQVVDWHNGVSALVPYAPAAPIDSLFGTIYWSWAKKYSPHLKKSLYMPPSGLALARYGFTDRNGGPWFAPAGFVRGLIPGIERVEYSPTKADREILNPIEGPNRINPLVTFPEGTVLHGNVTTQRAAGPTTAIHVVRLLLYVKRVTTDAIRFLHFDPNDPIMWATLVKTVNPILSSIKGQRGLETFKVVCDDTTNTPEIRAQRKCNAKVYLKHIDAAEIIDVDLILMSSGATLSL